MSRVIILSVLFFAACSSVKKSTVTKTDNELNQLEQLLSGSFSSELQSKEDTSYFNISLVMLPIWTNRTDGKWMYVEQAMATKLDKPYRQRVYHLQHSGKNTFTSDIYTIKNALTYAGLQNDKSKFTTTSLGSLSSITATISISAYVGISLEYLVTECIPFFLKKEFCIAIRLEKGATLKLLTFMVLNSYF